MTIMVTAMLGARKDLQSVLRVGMPGMAMLCMAILGTTMLDMAPMLYPRECLRAPKVYHPAAMLITAMLTMALIVGTRMLRTAMSSMAMLGTHMLNLTLVDLTRPGMAILGTGLTLETLMLNLAMVDITRLGMAILGTGPMLATCMLDLTMLGHMLDTTMMDITTRSILLGKVPMPATRMLDTTIHQCFHAR